MRGREQGRECRSAEEGRRCNAQGRLIRIIPHFEEAKVTTPATERQRGERVSVWGRRASLGSVFVVTA